MVDGDVFACRIVYFLICNSMCALSCGSLYPPMSLREQQPARKWPVCLDVTLNTTSQTNEHIVYRILFTTFEWPHCTVNRIVRRISPWCMSVYYIIWRLCATSLLYVNRRHSHRGTVFNECHLCILYRSRIALSIHTLAQFHCYVLGNEPTVIWLEYVHLCTPFAWFYEGIVRSISRVLIYESFVSSIELSYGRHTMVIFTDKWLCEI